MIARHRMAALLLAIGLAGTIALIYRHGLDAIRSSTDTDFPLPPYSESRYENAGPEARYIGVAACSECHKPQHLSYLHTAHSRALGDVDVADEPADAGYF